VHVALNAVHLVPGETGGLEIYARRLISALEEVDLSLRLTVFAGPQTVEELRREGWRAELSPVRVDARSRVRGVLAEQLTLRRAVRGARPDLLHNLLNTAPVWTPVPQVTTIHDLIYRVMPETHSGIRSWGLRLLVPLAARRSRRVIAVSEATKADVVRFLGVPAECIDVVPNGPGSRQSAEPTPESELRRRLGLGEAPVVLSLSAKRPHKNLGRLIEAMGSVDAALVLPGYPTPFEDDLRTLAEQVGVAERVRFTGWLSDEDVEGLYRIATGVVVPSLVEGFGMPVLEAMVRGVPVACSAIPPLREVAGDAALFFDPLDPSGIAAAIGTLLHEEAERARLAAAGKDRSELFSWERAARETIASYERALAA
jgi:glycosyltransferase involved in cell wall biosynthesis